MTRLKRGHPSTLFALLGLSLNEEGFESQNKPKSLSESTTAMVTQH